MGKKSFRKVVHSAGIEVHGVNQYAIAVKKEAGVDISNQSSDLHRANLVVTLCDDEVDQCPIIPHTLNMNIGDLMIWRKQKVLKRKNRYDYNVFAIR